MVDFGTAVRRYYANYTNPKGRSPRAEYWWVLLFRVIMTIVFLVILMMDQGAVPFLESVVEFASGDFTVEIAYSQLGAQGRFSVIGMTIFALVNFIPEIMINIRRFHDLGYTGWLFLAFMLAGALPVIGTMAGIANLIWFACPGTSGPNKFGPDPYGQDRGTFD